jgi:hypothetical protein
MESSRLEGSDNAELLKQRALNSSIVFLSSVAFFHNTPQPDRQ